MMMILVLIRCRSHARFS